MAHLMIKFVLAACLTVTIGSGTALVHASTQPLLRAYLEGLDAGDTPQIAGRRLEHAAILAEVYRARALQPLWTDRGELAEQAEVVMVAISESVGHGFVAERYHRTTLEQLLGNARDTSGLALELLLTDAFLGQALHRARGVIFPPNLDSEWQVPQADIDAGQFLQSVALEKRSVAEALKSLWPQVPEYNQLLRRRTEIAAQGDVVAVQVAQGPLLKPGQSNDRVVMLKERLLGPGSYEPLFDEQLRQEVMAFQRSSGLEPDGIVGEATLEVLNATPVAWIDRIDANLERWRWLPRQTPETYLRVNIAAYTLRAIDKGETALAMNVIVGQPYRRTPVFTETIKYLVLNPSWNVPFSIATKDKLPLLQANAAELAATGYEAKASGSDTFVSVDAIDWRGVTRRNFNFLLRQRPGPENALGRVKFMLPNPFAVYLHDTPSRELFAKQERSFSSGCVRLEQPLELAAWLLAREGHPDAGRLQQRLADGTTQTIYLKQPMPTYIVYFTAFTTDDGDVAFRRDIYDRDKILIQSLRNSS